MTSKRRLPRSKGFGGWILHLTTGFGLPLSVVGGFAAGYFLGGRRFGSYAGLIGALAGFVIGLTYLVWLAQHNGRD